MQVGFYHLETIYISPCYSRPNYIEYGCLNVIAWVASAFYVT